MDQTADATAIGDCEVVSLENQMGGRAQPVAEHDQVFVGGGTSARAASKRVFLMSSAGGSAGFQF